MAEPNFSPQAPVGYVADRAYQGFQQGESMMDRARIRRNEEEMNQLKMQQFREVLPAVISKARADKASYDASLVNNRQMETLRRNAAVSSEQANNDYNAALAVPDWHEQQIALAKLQAQYGWMGNVRDEKGNQIYKGFLDSLDESRANAITRAKVDSQYIGLTPEERARARRVELGIAPRTSGAAIQYREVIGPDGTPRLVALDPRQVGAQFLGTGETYGSGVSPASTQGQPRPQADPTLFAGQSTQEKAQQTEAGRSTAENNARLTKEKPKRTAALKQAEITTKRLASDIDELIQGVNATTAGPGGVLLERFPGTSAKDLASNLDSIKARIGFQALQAMRDASPTGGALGNITERENTLLQSQLGSLEIGQSPAQLIENLRRVRQRLIESYGIVRGVYDNEYSDGAPSPTGSSQRNEIKWDQSKESRLEELRKKLGK